MPLANGERMTQRMTRWLRFASALFSLLLIAPATGVAAAAGACQDTAHPDYRSHECKVERLRERPFVVVATIDSGVNPYHVDFRLPPDDDRVGVHPSEYIEGFPQDAPGLELSFDVSSPAEGRERDDAAWSQVESGTPHWIPGTNLIGVVPPRVSGDFFDTGGHGTGVASIAGGLRHGRGTADVVLVAVTGAGTGWRWAARQPWIDVISVSVFGAIPLVQESAEAATEAAESGKVSCSSSGNTGAPGIFVEKSGPSAPVHVGAVYPDTRERAEYSSWPVDVLGLTDQVAATHTSVRDTGIFGGTSAAAPHVCALIARTISRSRALVGDFREGPHEGGLVVGPPGPGAMADGVIDRLELEAAVQATADPLSDDDFSYVFEGYGLVEGPTVEAALEVLLGQRPLPARPAEDAWQQRVDAVRDLLWDAVPACPSPWFCD